MKASDLWQRILSAPGDKELKKQYIDALVQAGDSRAETFVIAAEMQKYPSYDPKYGELLRQYEQSLESWRGDFDASAKSWQAEVVFVQGWPVEITIAAREFTKHSAEIVKLVPLRHLNLQEVEAALDVFEVSQLAPIASLDCSRQRWTDGAIRALASCIHFGELRWLDLSNCQLTDGQVEILAACESLRQLKHLDVTKNPCRDPVDAAAGYGTDWQFNSIVPESIHLPEFGWELEERYGKIEWLHALDNYMEKHPPSRYLF